jgi:AbrB family looped-hinge helix DNA binding protein
VRITRKGQVTIPAELRERFGLLPGTEVTFRVEGGRIYLERTVATTGRGDELVRRMRGAATAQSSSDEILALTRD